MSEQMSVFALFAFVCVYSRASVKCIACLWLFGINNEALDNQSRVHLLHTLHIETFKSTITGKQQAQIFTFATHALPSPAPTSTLSLVIESAAEIQDIITKLLITGVK